MTNNERQYWLNQQELLQSEMDDENIPFEQKEITRKCLTFVNLKLAGLVV